VTVADSKIPIGNDRHNIYFMARKSQSLSQSTIKNIYHPDSNEISSTENTIIA